MRFFALFLLAVLPVSAATWYASTTGTLTNGTAAQPWSVEYAVSQPATTNTLLEAGDTVLFKSGTYICTQTNTSGILAAPAVNFYKSGTSGSKITYRSEIPWTFSFDGGLVIGYGVSNVVLKELRIFYSGSTNREKRTNYDHPGGINIFGKGIEVLHNLVENTGHPGIGSWSETEGKLIAGNIIRFSGADDYMFAPPNMTPRGSGMYLQNLTNESLIKGNISFFNHTTGMKAYTEGGWAVGFKFINNISIQNPEAGIFYHQTDNPSPGVTISNNWVWQNLADNWGLRLGYNNGVGGHSNAVVINNFASDSVAALKIEGGWNNSIFTNNTLVQPTIYSYRIVQLESTAPVGNFLTDTFDYNTYRSLLSGGSGFGITNVYRNFTDWKTDIGGGAQDANSTFDGVLPTNTTATPFNPTSDPAYVHVAVVNWLTNSTTTVDLSSFYTVNDVLTIYDAQALPTAYTNFIYTGAAVTLNLTLTNIVPMLGVLTNVAETWSGFDPRIRAFVIHKTGVGGINATTANVGTITLAP